MPGAAPALTARAAIAACPGLSVFILFKKMRLSPGTPVKAGLGSNAVPRTEPHGFSCERGIG